MKGLAFHSFTQWLDSRSRGPIKQKTSILQALATWDLLIEMDSLVAPFELPPKRIKLFNFKGRQYPQTRSLRRPLSFPQSIIDAYWKRLKDVSLGGPTYLAPVVQEIAAYAEKEVSQSSQHYTIGLVIVDGIVNDVDNLIEKLIYIGHLPLSIVVVGVGPTDFRLMVRNT